MLACRWKALDGVEAKVAADDPTPSNQANDEPGRPFYFLDPDGTEF